MSKRNSKFERVGKDFYPTPYEAVVPLFPHLPARKATYYEPCAGQGDLIFHLNNHAICIGHSDLYEYEPKWNQDSSRLRDAATTQYDTTADYFITNPPWDRKFLHPIIENLSNQKPTWLLFDADWMHTKQAIPLLKRCTVIVSVGRVKWFPESKMTGFDNVCWYKFAHTDAKRFGPSTWPVFCPRTEDLG